MSRNRLLLAAFAPFFLFASVARAEPLAAGNGSGPPRAGVHLSAAYERMLRDQYEAGRALPAAVVRRWSLDVRDEAATRLPEASGEARPFGAARAQTVALGVDHLANDRTGDVSCTACGGRPLPQAESTIAAFGNQLIAGWNDGLGFCPPNGAVQGYATSTDGGLTWTDRGDVPALGTGGRYRGDPVHFVNRDTGTFWILGLYEGGTPGSGLALLNGHFAGAAWVIDGNRQIAVGGADFLDKEWGAVDPATGYLYVTYSRFVGGTTSQIELIRSTDGGTTWSAPLLMHDTSQFGNVQGSRPVVGPDGELYVYWYEYGYPLSRHHVRKSTDFGASFGPDVVAATFYENGYSGGAGYRRGFAPTFASIAVDRSNGPRRGRVYLAWDEAVNFYDAPVGTLPLVNEAEVNGHFAAATSFTVGAVLRGSLSGTAADTLDLWRFTGTQGQTLFFYADSATSGATFQMRLQSDCDTTLFQNMNFLAFSSANFPAYAYTLPHTGTYWLRMFRSGTGTANYRLRTGWDTPSAGQRATDHRDQFCASSADGTTWTTPVRISDSAPYADAIFPEVAVDGAGRVFVAFHDWRDDAACGSRSYEYLVASGDGVAWGANRRLSDEHSYWSVNACGSANQGDYQGITAEGETVVPCWADSRNGDPDTFVERTTFASSPGCPASPVLGAGGATVPLQFSVANDGSSDETLAWRVEDSAGWLQSTTPASPGFSLVAAGLSAPVAAQFALPAGCVPAQSQVRFIVSNPAIPGVEDTCTVELRCGLLDVPGQAYALAFDAPRPNPSRGSVQFRFALPASGPARLTLYGADGRRIRTLADGERSVGLHALLWDGRDDGGRRVAPGVYWARLEFAGSVLRRAVHLVH